MRGGVRFFYWNFFFHRGGRASRVAVGGVPILFGLRNPFWSYSIWSAEGKRWRMKRWRVHYNMQMGSSSSSSSVWECQPTLYRITWETQGYVWVGEGRTTATLLHTCRLIPSPSLHWKKFFFFSWFSFDMQMKYLNAQSTTFFACVGIRRCWRRLNFIIYFSMSTTWNGWNVALCI